jgi:PAS domain S-box-containing protein
VGEHFSTLYTPTDVANDVPERALQAATTEPVDVRGWRMRANGSVFWASGGLAPLRDDDGTVGGYLAWLRNKGEDRSVGHSRELERYGTIVDSLWDGVYALDSDERFVMVNDEFLAMTGYDREDLIGEHASVVHSDAVNASAVELSEQVRSGDRDGAVMEFSLQRADGEEVPVESRFGPYRYDDGRYARTGVVRDITDRKRFEETFTSLHVSTERLHDAETKAEVTDVVVDAATDVLDLPAVVLYRHDEPEERLLPGAHSTEAGFMRDEFPPVPLDEQSITGQCFLGGETESFADIRERPELQVDPDRTEMRAGLFVPIDDHGILVAGSRESGEFSERTVHLVELLASNAVAAYDRVDREERLLRQGGQLRALDNLNAVVREITDAVVRQSTREEVETVVCERLAQTESYEFAWIAEADPGTGALVKRAEAGVDGYLDEVEISTDTASETGGGPTGRAIETHEMSVVNDVETDPSFETWREVAREFGYRSAAAIPIVYDDTLYGVLGIYSERTNAFVGREGEVIGRLGELVGHAIAGVERKQALMSDDVVEIEVRIRGVFDAQDAPPFDGSLTLDRTVPVDDDRYLVYGTVARESTGVLETLASETPTWESVEIIDERENTTQFELRLSKPPVISAVAAHGGYVTEAEIEGGDFRLVVHLPPTVGVRRIVEVIQESYPSATMVSRRQLTRDDDHGDAQRLLTQTLTDRQRSALEAAFFSGFFEWPRESTGEDVADSLGVSNPTFNYHLRHAQKRLLGELFT